MMPAVLPDQLDELEHQALDHLEELEDVDALGIGEREAIERVRAAFDRLAITESDRLLAAAQVLALAEPDRGLDPALLGQIRAQLGEDPSLASGLAPVVELIGLGLGLARDRVAWAILVEHSDAVARDAPADFAALSSQLALRLRDAWPQPESPAPSLAARVFRLEALGGAGPSLRARALAAEHPEHLRLANALVAAQPEAAASELFATFEAARAALESAASESASGTSEPALDGPKRRFTWVHALLAAIILALTLWHYLGR